jgi:thiol-disulfide isomerase/thioredoxin
MVAVIVALIAAFGLAVVIGKVITRRAGLVRAVDETGEQSPVDHIGQAELGLSRTGPTVLHFSAAWCGPCAAVRRVVDQVCAELPQAVHVEIDMDANPEAARRLSVLSLPTTFIFDTNGTQRFRTSGVPKAADLRSALESLLA